MRVFKTRIFHAWAKKIGLGDRILAQAAQELNEGKHEANLGGFLYKKRIAFGSRGKSGSLRTIIAFKKEKQLFFIFGFSKNQKTDVSNGELRTYKKLGKALLLYNNQEIHYAITNRKLIEVINT